MNASSRTITLFLALVAIALAVAVALVAINKFGGTANANDGEQMQAQAENSESGAEDPPGNSDADDSANAKPRTVRVTFAGDCTLGTDSSFDYATSFNAAFESKGDPSWFLANVKPLFEDDDLTIVNMEGTLTTSTARQDKTFAFKGDADYAKVFSSSSVEAASMANNHSKDYGQQSYDDTLAALKAENVEPFGYDQIAYMNANGVKVALIGTYELAQHEAIKDSMVANINAAREAGAELVLVYIHWGIERETVPNSTQIALGHAAIDAGADLVVGSHPHVIQGWEVYNGRYIVYSLGNFCFGGNSNPADKDCMIFRQTFTITGDEVAQDDAVEFVACSISSASGHNNYQPTPASDAEKDRIDAKIQKSTDSIAAIAA